MKDSKKQAIILSLVAIATFAILIIGATYAYFQAQTGASKSTDVKVTTYTTDVLTFTTGNAINIALTQSDFASGKGNAVGNTFAKASLTANNKTNTATEHYYVYLNISNNSFTYSIDENTPELILTVIAPDGTEVTSLEGLAHTSVTDGKNQVITGFDVTTKDGVIAIANNREITANPSKEEQYTIKLTFVNYSKDQSKNAGKELNAKVIIQKEEMKKLAYHQSCNDNTLACHVAKLYTGTQGENSIYYHNGTITSEDGIVIDAGDNSYRYAGASDVVNNFVCFGSDVTPCPTDNLYRIIGVFDGKVKFIKYDYATSTLLGTDGDYHGTLSPLVIYYKGSLTSVNTYYWNYKATNSATNIWSTSLLNKTNLNQNFITNIGTDWAEKIAITTWKVGGNTSAKIRETAMYVSYQNEIKNPAPGSTSTTGEESYEAKIGLMYVSDYGYAASPTYWTYKGNDTATTDYRAATTSNWMYMGYYDWTISRTAEYSNVAFYVGISGHVISYDVNGYFGVRPSFYLESSITYKSGSGTQSDPIFIN